MEDPTIRNMEPLRFSGILLIEAKKSLHHVQDHLPQVIGEIYACAKSLG